MPKKPSPPKAAAIVNPRSANGRTEELWPEIAAALHEVLGEFRFVLCKRPGHATELAREALHGGCNLIVSVGGDGTHNEVINGFFEGERRINPKAVMAILPQGTASDFARTLGIGDTEQAIAQLAAGEIVLADVGRVHFQDEFGGPAIRHFLNVAHFGLGGTVAERANEGSKAVGGSFPYFVASLKTFVEFDKPLLRLQIDDHKIEERCIDVIVANGRYFGGGIEVSEDVRLDDGRFEVYVVGDLSRGEALAALTRLYGGTVDEIDQVRHFRAKRVCVESEERVRVNLDGENPGYVPARVKLLPAALRLVCGRKRGPA